MALINFLKKKKEQIDKAIPDLNVRQRAAQAVKQVGRGISNIERASQQAGLRARQQVNRAAPVVSSFVKEAPKQFIAGTLAGGSVLADTGLRGLQKAEDIVTAPLGKGYKERLQNLRSRQSATEDRILQGLKPLEQKKGQGLQNYLKDAYNIALPTVKSAKQATPLQRGAAALDAAFNIATFGAGAPVKELGKQGLKQIAKQYGKTALLQGASGAAGAATMKDATAKDIAQSALAGAVFGTGLKGAGDVTRVATPAITRQISKAGQKVQTAFEQPKFQPGFASTKPKVKLEQKQPKTEAPKIQRPVENEIPAINVDYTIFGNPFSPKVIRMFDEKLLKELNTAPELIDINKKIKNITNDFNQEQIKDFNTVLSYTRGRNPEGTRIKKYNIDDLKIILKNAQDIKNKTFNSNNLEFTNRDKEPVQKAPVVKLATTEPRKPEITVLEAEKVPTLDNYKKIKSEDLYAELNRLDAIGENKKFTSEEDIKYSRIEKELSDRADNDALNSTVNNIKQNMEKSGFFDDNEITDSKKVLQKYNRDVTVQEIFTDFASALEGAKSWMPDTLKLKYSLIEANKKNIPIENLIKSYITKFKDYDIDTALDIAERKISEATGKKINIRDFLKTQQQPTQPIVKISQAQTKPTIKLTQPKVEVPTTPIVKIKSEKPIVSKKADELAQETIQKAVKEPISPEIAPIARVSTKVEPKVSPEPKTQPKKVVETSIDPSDPFGNRNRINQIRNELGSLVDTDYKMLKTLRKIEKETGAKGLVDQFEFDTGNIRASRAMANAKIRQSQELSDALSGLNKKQAQNFDEYIKARAELENYTPEMKTSKPREELARIVAAGDAEFSDRFGSINQYYKNMAQDMYDGGLIDQNTLNKYLADNNYVRLQRDVEDLVGAMPGKSGARSIRTTTAKQRRTGSERELLSPTQSLLKRTQQIELEIQRNKAANNIIDTLVEYGLATPVKQSKNKNTIARLVNGKKELFEVNGEIKQIIDNVNPYNLGVLAQIVSVPTRIFRAGTTALSAPFSVINYLRDQASSAIYSKNTLATHNPVNIITGLSNAVSDQVKGNKSPLWQKFERYIGDQTVYDELRNTTNSNRLLRETREGQVGRFKNAILDPIRTIEDINSITEKATRFQNFEGIYKNAIKKGLPEEEAIKEAVLAARRNSVDFNKGGDFTRVVNLFIPYFNASVQGTRNVVQAFTQRPVETAMKSIGFVALPSVIATAYNLSDETRKEAYNSINEFEKENNFIIIGPDAKQNEQGTWTGIYKIPKPQGYKELTDPVRDVTEAFLQGESVDNVSKMFYDMLGAVSGPFNIQSPEKFLGSIIPQAIKPSIQAALNKDIFTGKQIVPQYMIEQTETPTKRAFEGTSGSSRMIAEQLNVSPLQVEKFVKGTTGSLGQYATDLLDRALANAGIISKEQIGGRSIIEDVKRRLTEASGELPESKKTPGRKYFESVNEVKKDLSIQDQKAWDTLHPTKTNFLGEEIFDENKRISKYTKAGIYLNNPNVLEADRKLNQLMVQKGNPSNPFFELPEPLQRQVLLKEALPPGSKDPILSALYKEEWFQDYQKARSDYYEQVKASMAKQGKELPKSTNPYPTTPPELQKVMDYYSSLPKGTGARSKWIKANPGLWQQMTAQWEQVDAWENKERVAMGIPEIVQEDTTKKAGSGKVGKKRISVKSLMAGEKRLKDIPKVKGRIPIVKLKAEPKLAAIKLKRKATAPAIKLAPTRKAKPKKLTIRNIRVK